MVTVRRELAEVSQKVAKSDEAAEYRKRKFEALKLKAVGLKEEVVKK